jgi:uncharacterized protein involved in exopolysaccharide biosynthesis/Mrp family chromosome partitioning ATPase
VNPRAENDSDAPVRLLPGRAGQPAPAERGPSSGSLRDMFDVLFQHKFKMLVFFISVVLAAFAVLLAMERTYTSEAKILLRRGRETILLDPTVATGEVAPLFMEWENSMNSEIEILTSRELAARVVQAIGPKSFEKPAPEKGATLKDKWVAWTASLKKAMSPSEPDAPGDGTAEELMVSRLTLAFSKALIVKVIPKSNIITISYDALDPVLARTVVTTLLDLYQQMHILANRAPGAHEFFVRQTDALRAQLEALEDTLRDLKTQSGISSLDSQRAILLNRIGTLQSQQEQLEGEMAASVAKVKAGEEAVRQESAGGKTAPLAASGYYRDVRAALLAETTALAGLTAQAETVKRQIGDAQSEMKGLNEHEIRISRMERDRDMLRDKYVKYNQNLEQTRIDQALQADKISNISIIQPPTLAAYSNPLNRVMKMLLAVMVGLFGSVCLAFLADHLDHTLKKPEDIEQLLQLPTLVSIPRLRYRSICPAASFVSDGSDERKFRGSFAFYEARHYFGILRDRIQMSAPKTDLKDPLIIGITSSHYGEGVSSVAANLAISFAEKRRQDRVLLVDANKEQPSAHHLFGIKQTPGAAEIMMDSQGRLVIVEQNFYKVSDENPESEPATSLLPLNYDNLLRLVRDRDFRYVIFDLPPLSEGGALQIAAMMDGVVFVVKAEGVRGEIVQRMKNLLASTNTRILGAVLNKRRFYLPQWLYQRL